jgi:hypothetical protein
MRVHPVEQVEGFLPELERVDLRSRRLGRLEA